MTAGTATRCLLLAMAAMALATALGAAPGSPAVPAASADLLWPKPQHVSTGNDRLDLPATSSGFTIAATSATNADLEAAMQRYQAILYPTTVRNTVDAKHATSATKVAADGTVSALHVDVGSVSAPLALDMDESYKLQLDAPAALLTANTIWGAMRGLETFVQLVQKVPGTSNLFVADAPVMVADSPRFTHRGLLVDTSRHYLPMDILTHTIDALVANKMSVLHVHWIDAQSFPVESASFPKLTDGAWSNDLVYTAAQLAALVKYGKQRGIRIIPEFDVPGHAYSWGIGYPNITATCPDWSANINNVPLNPTNPFALEVLQGFLHDMISVFNDSLFHIGGDEVVYACWQEDPSIQKWMAEHNFANYNDLMQYFVTDADRIVIAGSRRPVHWDDVFDEGIVTPIESVIQVWRDRSTLAAVVKSGYNAILSNSNKWYLNCGFNPGCEYISWQDAYLNEPFANMTLTPAEEALVLGGEAAQWGAYTDHTNLDQQVWPRASAVAERLWSSQDTTDLTDAATRLTYHRCRMVARGIAASPMEEGFCPDMFP